MANGYKKISGGAKAGRLAVTTMSLWQGPDHLLQIERDGYGENYRRFFYADIEIFTVRLDNRRRNIAFILGGLAAVMLAIAFIGFAGSSSGGGAVFLTFAGIFLMPFIYNMVRGPTCVAHIATAVQREQLRSVGRLKQAMRLLQVIRDGANQAQGTLAPDMVRVKFELQNAPPPLRPPSFAEQESPIVFNPVAQAPAEPPVEPPPTQ